MRAYQQPIVHDLFCGLEGWGEGFVSEGYRVIGYDIVDMYKELGYQRPAWAELILCDVRSIHGSQCKDAAVIVASPPCQGYSYRAMPWKRAKALPPPDNTLFNECFRIQREASEAAGHYIPLIVENVRGAEKWVGSARWHFGSYYLWGDVPALMPPTKGRKVAGFSFDGSGKSYQTEALRQLREQRGMKSPGTKLSEVGFNARNAQRFREEHQKGIPHAPTGHWTNPRENGTKQPGIGGARKNGKGDAWFQDGAARHGSKSDSRKAASAEIAKIPFPLAQWIAKCFKPVEIELAGGQSK